jgi:alkylation response protein AidB-like acyl-CoA dehydrogenase
MPDRKDDNISDTARMVRDSAGAVVRPGAGLSRVRNLRFRSPGFDRETYKQMAEMGWLTLRLPEDAGGLGLGMREYCALAESLGAGLVPEPFIGGALALRLAQARLHDLGPVEDTVVLAAWQDRAGDLAWRNGASCRNGKVTGRKVFIPAADGADAFAVATPDGIAIVARDAAGLDLVLDKTQDGGCLGQLTLHDAPARIIIPASAVDEALDDAALAVAAYLLGLAERTFDITVDYLKVRNQFDRPIGSFQAVSSRLADGYIDVKALRLTLKQAAWRLSEDLPADAEVSTAAFWAADAGHRVAHTTVHVHGGVGIDMDHPVHRYFLAAKQTEFAVGSATGQLLRIGRELADTPA